MKCSKEKAHVYSLGETREKNIPNASGGEGKLNLIIRRDEKLNSSNFETSQFRELQSL